MLLMQVYAIGNLCYILMLRYYLGNRYMPFVHGIGVIAVRKGHYYIITIEEGDQSLETHNSKNPKTTFFSHIL